MSPPIYTKNVICTSECTTSLYNNYWSGACALGHKYTQIKVPVICASKCTTRLYDTTGFWRRKPLVFGLSTPWMQLKNVFKRLNELYNMLYNVSKDINSSPRFLLLFFCFFVGGRRRFIPKSANNYKTVHYLQKAETQT